MTVTTTTMIFDLLTRASIGKTNTYQWCHQHQ